MPLVPITQRNIHVGFLVNNHKWMYLHFITTHTPAENNTWYCIHYQLVMNILLCLVCALCFRSSSSLLPAYFIIKITLVINPFSLRYNLFNCSQCTLQLKILQLKWLQFKLHCTFDWHCGFFFFFTRRHSDHELHILKHTQLKMYCDNTSYRLDRKLQVMLMSTGNSDTLS